MKRYSLTNRLPDRLPMTPPDEAPEPDCYIRTGYVYVQPEQTQ